MTFNPNPKPEVIILKGRAYHLFRKEVALRACYQCYYCQCYAPFDSETLVNGEVSHDPEIRSKGGDVFENAKWSCWRCHRNKHAGNLKSKKYFLRLASEEECQALLKKSQGRETDGDR